MDCETVADKGKKTEDVNSNSGGKTKTTVILLKQLCFQTNDEIKDEDESFFKSMEGITQHPRLAWTLLTWDGSLEGISLLSTLYHDHKKAKAREANPGDGDGDEDGGGDNAAGFGIVGMLPYPKGFGSTCGNTLAVCNSKIYFIGGTPLVKPLAFSKQVLSFVPVYLVHQGEDKLLILCEAPMDPNAVDCRVFQVKQDHPSFHLQYMGYRSIDTMNQFQLQDARVLCDM